jgi:hypothetical protein
MDIYIQMRVLYCKYHKKPKSSQCPKDQKPEKEKEKEKEKKKKKKPKNQKHKSNADVIFPPRPTISPTKITWSTLRIHSILGSHEDCLFLSPNRYLLGRSKSR